MLAKISIVVSSVLVALTTGCTIMAPSYMPDYTVLDALRRQHLRGIAIEPIEPKDSNAGVNSISLRGSQLTSTSGSYAQYLEDAIKSDLIEAMMLDPNSTFRLSATLLKNDIDVTGFSTGVGTIEVKFSINRESITLFDKTLAAETEFESSFARAVAIPKAQTEYPNLVRALLIKLYTDKEFVHVLQK